MSGHSARRSGAMAYVRKGMDIKDLAYLGRWRSSVVLTYAEEALESMPANARIMPRSSFPGPCCRSSRPVVVESIIKDKARSSRATETPEATLRPKPAQLWVRSTERRGGNPIHFIADVDWSVPMVEWSTACGWNFARKSAQVAFVTNPSLAILKCKKCLAMRTLRDDVKESVQRS